MIDKVLIGLGIYATSRVISFLANEISDTARERNHRFLEAIENYNAKQEKLFEEIDAEHMEAVNRDRQLLLTDMKDVLSGQIDKAIADNKSLYNELRDVHTEIYHALHDEEAITALRKNSLERLDNQIYEAQKRSYGYGVYLKRYKVWLWQLTSDDIGEVKSKGLPMRLPESFPYIGKVVYLDAAVFDEKGYWTDRSLPEADVTYFCDPAELMREKVDAERMPFMVESDRYSAYDKTLIYGLSLAKGRFYTEALGDTRLGVSAAVTELLPNGVKLEYEHKLSLFMPKSNFQKPYKTPPVRAELQVYPTEWRYGLQNFKRYQCQCLCVVSEKVEDAVSSLRFGAFPLVFTQENWQTVCRYMDEKHLNDVEDEWKIGPADEKHFSLAEGNYIKMQFSEEMVILAQLQFCRELGETALVPVFCKLLSTEEGFKSDDIFVDMDIEMLAVCADSLDQLENYKEDMKELDAFLFEVFAELRVQRQNKLSMAGSVYFRQWGSVMQELIQYLRKGTEFSVAVSEIRQVKDNAVFIVKEPEQLQASIKTVQKAEKRRDGAEDRMNFFVEDTCRERHMVKISPDCRSITAYNLVMEKEFWDEITLFAEAFPYAEIQQKRALSQIITGKMTNAKLQSAMMDGCNVMHQENGDRLGTLANPSILENPAQYDALRRAYEEKDIFLIQGPPGTGKTTVIRELIMQYHQTHPDGRILVVSQANVAVDNALSGLLAQYGDLMIRCGNADKISENLRDVSLPKRYDEYIRLIRENRRTDDLYRKWYDCIQPAEGMNSNIGELMIRNRAIVGATCIGLARKRIGLDQIHFDLVIADEAGKALPGEILIPVLHARKLILIGDHRQLPPVIHPALFDPDKIELQNREMIIRELFTVSLFQRLFERVPDSNKAMLRTQYRMPAVVGTLVSKLFYDGRLVNGAGTDEKVPLFSGSNLTMYDFSQNSLYRESIQNGVVVNDYEVQFVMQLLQRINRKITGCSIAVITPYRGQKRKLERAYMVCKSELPNLDIHINTVDAFQGDEAEIVIYCTTRAYQPTMYFSDERRINVALSRTKNELLIVGSIKYFKKYKKTKSPLPDIAEYIRQYGKIESVKEHSAQIDVG